MPANLYPGIKSLHLVLDTPYDLIRTDDVRDDLVGVRVWYSTTQGFNPLNSQGTLAFDGLSQSVIISELETNTRYYVRYAFISAIDPTTFTVSSELTAEVLDENVTVSGYLTNDPTAIATNADGSGGNFALTQGVFKVFDLSQDVTGAGPQYGIVANSVFGGLVGSIHPTTGVYSATSLAEDAGNVTFYATYNGITITKVWNLLKSSAGSDAPSLRIKSTGNAFVFEDENASTTTSNVTISTSLQNLTGSPVYSATAYSRAGVSLGSIQFTTVSNTITISGTQFNPVTYNNTVGYVEVTSTLGSVSDSISLYRINNGSEQITVEQSNQTHTITAFTDGSVATPDYVGSGTIIKVKQGNTYLPVDNNSPYTTGSWRVDDITAVGITADTTPSIGGDFINYDQHSAMTADVAYIDYRVVGTSTTGKIFSITVRQSFSKSKAGVRGSSAPVVSLTASTQTFTVAKNTGTVTPTTAVFTASVVNITNPVYAWTVDGVTQASTTSTLTVASFTGSPKIVKVVVTGADSVNVFDQATLYSLREGDDSLQAGLSNENQTIACDPTGEPIAGQFPLSSQLVVVRGAVVLTSGVTYSKVSETGMSSTINASTGVITINSVSADFGSAVYRATVGSSTLDKTFTFNKSKNGARGSDGAPGAAGAPGPLIEISGLGTFYRSSGGAITPSSSTLQTVVTNITSPSYSWSITGATPATATGSSVTITPTGSSSTVVVTLTVSAGNLAAPLTITRGVNVVDQGAAGQAGQNGTMSAFPTIYQWTSGSQPARPGTNSTYTWSSGAYTAPSGWSTLAPTNTSPGWVLWTITVPLTVSATTTTSTLDWTNTAYTIRASTANGVNGANGANGAQGPQGAQGPAGANGTNGANGANGSDGNPGSASYLINRGGGSSSSQPTGAEVLAATGFRYAQLGDIATISYNSGNNSVAYRATSSGFSASWALQTSYITGSLIVQNSISGDRITANSLSVDKITSGNAGVSVINVNGQFVNGSFALGSGQRTPMGNTAAIGSFTCTTNTGWALAGFNTNTAAGEWGNGILAATSSPGGTAIGCYSLASQTTTQTNIKFATVMGETGAGGYALGTKTSSWFLSSAPDNNNLRPQYRRVYSAFGMPNYGVRSELFGNVANLSAGSIQDLGVIVGELGYCSDDQTSSFAALLVRRHISGGSRGQEACRVVIAPSWNTTRAIEVSGGLAYTATVGHFPGGITNFTGVHESQSDVELTVGDILIDVSILEKEDVANVFSQVAPSTTANDTRVIGVVAHNQENLPVPFLPDDDSGSVAAQGFTPSNVEIFKELEPWKLKYTILVNGLGEGQVNVCGEAGDIMAGDLIVTSSMPGKGMRQSDDVVRSYTVAKARESVVFDSPDQVKMIACIYLCG